ncbi:uncharacterized protein V2V93DRAFT_5067 [Kockiozyma suomiensis]|uniref:uncharacterized protein n=1 Tax=Kockiozyma suomiensis TaxID=1337062 RepID=UPI003344024F
MDNAAAPRAHRGYFATPLNIHVFFCGAISFVFTFVLVRVLGHVLQLILQLPTSSSTTSDAVQVAAVQTQYPSTSHITLIDKFVLVFEEEFGSSSSMEITNASLFRFCGVLLYTLYAVVIAFALSFSALFHSFSFIFFVWRKWIGIGKGLYGVWNSDSGMTGVW